MNTELLVALLSAGGVCTLIVERLFSRRADKAAAGKSEVEKASETAKLYVEIRTIINSELEPIQAELTEIKEKYCCYRERCKQRIAVKSMLDVEPEDHDPEHEEAASQNNE